MPVTVSAPHTVSATIGARPNKNTAAAPDMKSGKIVLVGDGACGKTCLLEVFRKDRFPEEYVPTVVDNFVKTVRFDTNKVVSLALWDTAGQENYDTIRPLSYRDTDLVLLCYTIENPKNFPNISEKWLMEIKNYCPTAGYFLVGLKRDLRYDDGVDEATLISEEDGKAMAAQIHAEKFIECSARTRENVDTVFIEAARYIEEQKTAAHGQEGCWCWQGFRCCGS